MNDNQKSIYLILTGSSVAFDARFERTISRTAPYDSRFGFGGLNLPALHSMVCVLKHEQNLFQSYSFASNIVERSAFSGAELDAKLVTFPYSNNLEEELDSLPESLVRKIGFNLLDSFLQINRIQADSEIDLWETNISYREIIGIMSSSAGYSAKFATDLNKVLDNCKSKSERDSVISNWYDKVSDYLEASVDNFLEHANNCKLKEYLD